MAVRFEQQEKPPGVGGFSVVAGRQKESLTGDWG